MELVKVLESLLDLKLSREPQGMVLYTDEPKTPAYITLPNDEASKRFFIEGVYGQGLVQMPHLQK